MRIQLHFLMMVTAQLVRFILLSRDLVGRSVCVSVCRELTDILICKLVRQSHTLRLMFYRAAIDDGLLELLHNSLVNGIALSNFHQGASIWSRQGALRTKSSTVHAFCRSTTGAE